MQRLFPNVLNFADSNNNNLATHSEAIVDTLNHLLMWEEPDVQYNAAGALFNMMAMSGKL